jgi:hypothetical protein
VKKWKILINPKIIAIIISDKNKTNVESAHAAKVVEILITFPLLSRVQIPNQILVHLHKSLKLRLRKI